ncbi:MAG TPA: hypothetical protein VFT37_02075 [Telluria sp.]|nr:hypothetical protein [Telluria sp.]
MQILAQSLVITSAGIIFSLGLLHLLFTYAGNKFHPRDAELLVQLRAAPLVITRQTTVWRAWIGFNASHSLGAVLFGAMYAYLALQHPVMLFDSVFLGTTGLAALGAYLVMAKLYWFRIPFRGISLALALYIAGFALAHSPLA